MNKLAVIFGFYGVVGKEFIGLVIVRSYMVQHLALGIDEDVARTRHKRI
jgi:hypothetical protein